MRFWSKPADSYTRALNAVLIGREAVPASDFVALGVINGNSATLIEQWNGTSWSIIDATVGFGPTGVTALGEGTVVVVGENGGILEN